MVCGPSHFKMVFALLAQIITFFMQVFIVEIKIPNLKLSII